MDRDGDGWVLLTHQLPREPSTPRTRTWRRLRDLGVLQLGDGLVALPYTAELLEQLEWVAGRVREDGGTATVWVARPSTRADGQALRERLMAEREADYAAFVADVEATTVSAQGAAVDGRTVARLRRELRRIGRRDHLRADGAAAARRALQELATGPAALATETSTR